MNIGVICRLVLRFILPTQAGCISVKTKRRGIACKIYGIEVYGTTYSFLQPQLWTTFPDNAYIQANTTYRPNHRYFIQVTQENLPLNYTAGFNRPKSVHIQEYKQMLQSNSVLWIRKSRQIDRLLYSTHIHNSQTYSLQTVHLVTQTLH